MAINIIQGYNPSTTEPIDSRQLVANQAARYAIATFNAYNGMIVYQQDTKALWVLTNTTAISGSSGWTQVGAGSGSSIPQYDGLITTHGDPPELQTLYDPEGWDPSITANATAGIYRISFPSSTLTAGRTHVQISAGIVPDSNIPVLVDWEFDSTYPNTMINFYTYTNSGKEFVLAGNLLERASITVKVYP